MDQMGSWLDYAFRWPDEGVREPSSRPGDERWAMVTQGFTGGTKAS